MPCAQKIRDHFFEGWKIFAVDGEGRVALLVVDVQIDGIGGNFFLAERLDDFASLRFGIVTVSALLVAKRPERRKRGSPNKSGVLLDDFLRFRAGDEVIVQLAAIRSKREIVARLLSKVEAAAVGVVEENAVGRAFAKADEKRNCLIERIIRFLPAEKIGVPHRIRVIAAVHWAGFVAQTEIILVSWHSLPGMDVRAIPSHRQRRLIGKKDVA